MTRKTHVLIALAAAAAFLIYAASCSGDKGKETEMADIDNKNRQTRTATFAGGCFWCMEPPFENVEGVISVVAGYAGGTRENPSYREVAGGKTKYVEAVQVQYDPQLVSYQKLLDIYWSQTDPTDAGGSFVDRGPQYRPVIFYHSPAQKQQAERFRGRIEAAGLFEKPVATEIRPFTTFYKAEDYHQDYWRKNPAGYKSYRYNSGRDRFIEKHWKNHSPADLLQTSQAEVQYLKPESSQLLELLSDIQYRVTQENATEKPFENAYWDHREPGIYVDIVSGEPLFASVDKFDSKTGWPSFTRPITPDAVVEKKDKSLFMTRIEVRSRHADSHLGHVFEDGPRPAGRRYCINSASLRFVPAENLEQEGYEKFRKLFEQ